jgi:HEAT repeat protein
MSVLFALGIVLILTLLEVGVFVFFGPQAGSPAQRWQAFPNLVVQNPALFSLPLGELLTGVLISALAAKPLGLLAYLRAVHTQQEAYHQLYTPLKALTNLRQATEQQSATGQLSMQEEQISILDLIQQQHSHQLILGVPGAGKTMALRVYQYELSSHPLQLVRERGQIPVYVPMKNYSLFLKAHQGGGSAKQASIIDFLSASDLPGMTALRPYLQQMAHQGRLLLLCDGLNEIDSNYLTQVCEELVQWMRGTGNRLVMTCREVDYREQSGFVQMVEEGYAARAVIYPLQPEQVSEFVERYVERQGRNWQHTAGQILHVIDRSRLRYHCTNPMMLFTLMGIIDKIGVERGKQIDTRGRLLREYVRQLIAYEQRQPKWNRGAPTEREVIRSLSEVACAARWANDRNAIQLRVSTRNDERVNFDELADELQIWLDEHPAKGPFLEDDQTSDGSEAPADVLQVLQFALSAALIDLSPGGVLSFKHELIAEYFVAEHFALLDGKRAQGQIREELLEDVGRWSEPVAIWAGLIDNPLALAERFGALGRNNPAYVLQALALGLVCVGVLWTPPQAETQRTVTLPASIEDALAIAVRNRDARYELARIFTRCAEEGGQEVYRSLLPLLMVEGIDELLILLDQSIVPEMLFMQLIDAIDNIAYEAQVKRLTRVLGRFGPGVVKRASQLSQPAAGRSVRLRAAAINILGGTSDVRAVEFLVARMHDVDGFVLERATNALIRLGPELALSAVLQELKKRAPSPFASRVHRAVLLILNHFLDDERHPLSLMQFQHILDTVVPVLTSNYENEPEVQVLAREILVRQASTESQESMPAQRSERVITALISYLSSQNEIVAQNVILALREIGRPAIPRLLELFDQPVPLLRARALEIVKSVRDPQALPHLLRLLDDSTLAVQEQVGEALIFYAPESIPGLIDLVLNGSSDALAERAASILSDISASAVEPVIQAIFTIVPRRTRLLVQVLEQSGDARCIPALITLLQEPDLEALLIITLIRALSHFADERVVIAMLRLLDVDQTQIYEEAIDALSQIGPPALEELLEALNVANEIPRVQRVQRAILGMRPFPGVQLIEALSWASSVQAHQIIRIFKAQGADAALVLASNLLHPDEPVRDYVRQALNEMPATIVVPALLEALHQPVLRPVASELLLRFPDIAIAPLVELLGERERGDISAQILPRFGPRILSSLVLGLDDQRSMARELALRIIVSLARVKADQEEVLHLLVRQLSPELPARARDMLLRVLTSELADISLPALLEGLEDAHLIDDVADSFVLLAHKAAYQQVVLDCLVEALYRDERRRGAQVALASIGAPAVVPVGALMTDQNHVVAKVSREILREIGVPALRFIWMAHSDTQHPERREAALTVFHSMHTEVIKDELIALLTSQKPDDIAMAASLLLERIHDEAGQNYADRTMVSELVEYVQVHGVDQTNLRVVGLLLLLGEHVISRPLIQALDEYPQQRRQLIYSLLLLGEEAQQALLDRFVNAGTPDPLRAEIASVLGMVSAPEVVEEEAKNLSRYGLTARNTGMQAPTHYAVALHALGGLLASGNWNARRLMELRNASAEGSPERELFNQLLGLRYEPQLAQLRDELLQERELHQREVTTLTTRIVADQQRLSELDKELEQEKRERGSSSRELQQMRQEYQKLQAEAQKILNEQKTQEAGVDQLMQERAQMQAALQQAQYDRNVLMARLERGIQEKQLLEEQNERLIQQLNRPGAR